MPETIEIEETVEVLPVKLAITLNSPVGYAVTALALYGAKAATTDARRVLAKVRDRREARKAAKIVESATPPQK